VNTSGSSSTAGAGPGGAAVGGAAAGAAAASGGTAGGGAVSREAASDGGAGAEPAVPGGSGGRRTDFVQSLDRGLAVIRCFSSEHPSLTLSEVAERTGLTRAAARRFLLTLQELGYVGSSGRQFSLRPRVLALGYAYLSSFSVAQIAQPHLEDLAEELHESCSVSVLDGDDIVYVARASANRIMTIALTVGTRLPPYPTSMGRVLLAWLPEAELDALLDRAPLRQLTEHTVTDPGQLRAILAGVRASGWAAVDQELEAGVRSIAVPIRDSAGRVIAAINASAHAARVPMRTLEEEFLPRLLDAARQIDAELASRMAVGGRVVR
jgi:IclR family transcriptional regulator, pca regulon regulatory protein